MRAFVAALFLFAGAINFAMWYRPAPAQARPVASWLDPNKVQDRLPVKPVPTTTYRLDAAVHPTPERVSLPWSCETIRQAVSGMSAEQIERLARMYRLSKWQRAEAKRCLKKENT